MLHLRLPWDSSHKVFKHWTKTYVKTDLGNSVCASHELSEIKQDLVEIWDHKSRFVGVYDGLPPLSQELVDRFVFTKLPQCLTVFLLTLTLPRAICSLVILNSSSLCSTKLKAAFESSHRLHPWTLIEHLLAILIRSHQSLLCDPLFTFCTVSKFKLSKTSK